MTKSLYTFLIVNISGGWDEVKYTFDDDDEPINVFCGHFDTNNNSDDFAVEYFIVHTFKGRVLLFRYSNSLDVTDPIFRFEDLNYDHAYCMNNYIFLSSEKELRIFSFDGESSAVSLEKTLNLPSPVLNMKSPSTDILTLFIHLQDYSLKILRKQNMDTFIDLDSNILMFDVCENALALIKNNLTETIFHLNYENLKESINEEPEQLKVIPYHIYIRKNEFDGNFKCMHEILPGTMEIDSDNLIFSKLIIKNNNLIYCDNECNKLSLLRNDPFFEINDQIILFDQFKYSTDLVIIIRLPDFGIYPQFISQCITGVTELDCLIDSVNIETGEIDPSSPFTNFYNSNIFLTATLNLFQEKKEQIFEERAERFVQILHYIISIQTTFYDTFLLSRILTYQFFKCALNALQPSEEIIISPVTYACLAVLIDKAIKVASCKLSSKMLYLLRTDKNQNYLRLSIIPPVLSQFNNVHDLAMSNIENLPEEIARKTLSSLLSCLKYSRCDIILFTDECFKLQVIEDLNENVLFLFRKLLILGSTIKNDRLPDLVRLLLFSYRFISTLDPNNELLNKIRDFFEHKPQDLDRITMDKIQGEFNRYILELKSKFEEFLDQVRFYPQKDINPEIQKFIKSHIPITILDNENKFRDDIEKLSKSGRLLRIKIEYINMIQDADDYITICQSMRFSRKRGDF